MPENCSRTSIQERDTKNAGIIIIFFDESTPNRQRYIPAKFHDGSICQTGDIIGRQFCPAPPKYEKHKTHLL